MKCRKCILCLLMVTACGVTQTNLNTLEKLRSTHPKAMERGRHNIGYDLMPSWVMTLIPFLIQTLTDENLKARQWMSESESVCRRVMYFLEEYYPDTRVLAGTHASLFIRCSDQHLRIIAAGGNVPATTPSPARPLLIECLAYAKEPMSRLIAVNALEELGDKRASRNVYFTRLVCEFEHPKT